MARNDDGPGFAGYLFRLLFVLVLLAGVGFVSYAYVADLDRPATPRLVPVTLGAG
jgi:hypothetical protein